MASSQQDNETTVLPLASLLDAGDGAVVTLAAGETRLAAHRAVLAARSPVFAAMFGHDTLEASSGQVDIPDVEGAVLCELVSYLYTLQVPQLPGTAPQLLAAADKYGVSGLKAACEQQVAAQLSVETAAAAAVLAVRHSCHRLKQTAVSFIKAHTHQVMATQGWADAVSTQPKDVVEVSRLLADPPAKTRSPSAEKKGRRLREAAKEGAVGELEVLLVVGADVAATDAARQTALHLAAEMGQVEVARLLLCKGAEVDARGRWQQTPLHLAAAWDHEAVVRLLLDNGADHGARCQSGRTPLHWAAINGQAEAVAALLQAGADRAAVDNEGKTPLDKARQKNKQQVVDLLSAR